MEATSNLRSIEINPETKLQMNLEMKSIAKAALKKQIAAPKISLNLNNIGEGIGSSS
jgi:hypothetical protein